MERERGRTARDITYMHGYGARCKSIDGEWKCSGWFTYVQLVAWPGRSRLVLVLGVVQCMHRMGVLDLGMGC